MSRVLRDQLFANDGESMLMGELGCRLENAIMQDHRLRIRALCFRHENPGAFRSLRSFIDDTIVHVLQDLAGPP